MRKLTAALLLAAAAGCTANPPPVAPGPLPGGEPVPAMPHEILAAQKQARPGGGPPEIVEATVRGHMEFLASDALNGRASGTRDEWIAATYIASQMRQWGLEPMGDDGGFVQLIEMAPLEAVAAPVLTAGIFRITHGHGMLVQALGGAGQVSGLLHHYRDGAPVPDNAVAIVPADAGQAALRALASAAIIITRETARDREGWSAAASRLPMTAARAVRLDPGTGRRATRIVMSEPAYDQLNAMPDGAAVTFEVQTKPGAVTGRTWNAVGRIVGSDPRLTREVIVLSAHLDHVGAREVADGQDGINNGADDDASGTTAVLELARALSRGPRPARTIVFALFGSEERGGHGAGYFVDLPVVPLDRIVADLQFEMLGRPDPSVPRDTLWLTGYERSNLGPELAKRGARLVADPHPDQSFFTRSDNIRFARRGVVAHTISSFGLHTDYHRPSDELRTIDFVHMTEAIRSLLEPIRWLADSNFRPAWSEGGCPAPCR